MRSGLVVLHSHHVVFQSNNNISRYHATSIFRFRQVRWGYGLIIQGNTYVGHLEPLEVKRRQKSVSTNNITWVTLEEQNMNTHCHKTLKCYKQT